MINAIQTQCLTSSTFSSLTKNHNKADTANVKVAIIKPGRIRTAIWEKGEELLLLYDGSIFNKVAKSMGKSAIESGKNDSLQPIKVAELVLKALIAKNPKPRYVIAPNPVGIWTREHLPDRIVDTIVKNKMIEARDS
jgi:short-subunit dehydrogenase